MSTPIRRFTFSKKSIEALPPNDPDSKSTDAEYSDAECMGLKLRVSKKGRKFFQHRYRYMGRKKCLNIGEFPYVSVADARKKVHEHKSLLARDIDPSDERSRKTDDLTFKKFAEEFYMPHAEMHKKTFQEDQYKLDGQIVPALGDYRLSSITARDISTLLAKQKERTSATTANHYGRLLKRMFNLAVKWGLIEKSPATGLDKFKEKPHRERYLSKEELPRFLKALDFQDDTLPVSAIKLLLFTGCRKGEILSLRWDQVSLTERRISLHETKNGKSRSVFLNDMALSVLTELETGRELSKRLWESDYLFPSRGKSEKPHMQDVRKTFEKACDRASITGLRIHDLRHSFATFAIQGGATLYDVQKLLGHSDISMTQRYAHMVDESLQKATDNMAKVIDQAIAQ